ncbi:MAG: S8 family serine peptidase [Bacteroidales bacterium]|nr:S8 family serine peptidase [Bacteroidales bacterium]
MIVTGWIKLCNTKNDYFYAAQGIERYRLIDRFDQLKNIINHYIKEEYRCFLSQPVENSDINEIDWYAIKYNDVPVTLSSLKESGTDYEKYSKIKEDTLSHYNSVIEKFKRDGSYNALLNAEYLEKAIKFVNDDFVFCYDDRVVLGVWSMKLKSEVVLSTGVISYPFDKPKVFNITFNAGEHGKLVGNAVIKKNENKKVLINDIPTIEANDDYIFTGWDMDPTGFVVNGDAIFTAQYQKKEAEPVEEPKPAPPVPPIPPKLSWWQHFKNWWKRKGCLTWLLRILIGLLLLLLLLWLISKCNRCSRHNDVEPPVVDRPWVDTDPNVGVGDGGIYDPGNPYTPVPTPSDPGNGSGGGYGDVLPPNQGVLPPIDSDPVIIPGNPTILGDRLNILMENEDKSIMDLAVRFKELYSDEKYEVIYYDDVVKRMQIKVPQEERQELKQRIPEQFAPEYELYVFDEALFESVTSFNDPMLNDSDIAWYLEAINAFDAWTITTGSPNITVAIVDNGFNLNHPELKDKVVMPYNVWSHSKDISAQEVDHGTHVAGTAIASANNGIGLCGLAPNCKFMPIQVADKNGIMTTTSILDGILYALYQGADVVNISLGQQFVGLDAYPEEVQRELEQNHFKEEERLWREIEKIANKHNTVIVRAAGNDNVLAGVDAMNRPDNIITVSAVDKSYNPYTKASFSNYGEYSTISAPGVDIMSSYGNKDYVKLEGTSMAAPIVTGCVALIKSINDTITNEQIICVLQITGLQSDGNIGNLIQIDKALKNVQSGEFVDCVYEKPNPVPSTGDVQILLSWNNYNDLDLYCVDPADSIVFFKNPRVPSGGRLEIDMNAQSPYKKNPIENIYWPKNKAPNGKYKVFVHYYKVHEQSQVTTPFNVKVIHNGVEDFYEMTAQKEGDLYPICAFVIGDETVDDSGDNDLSRRQQLIIERERLQKQLDEIDRELNNMNK